MLTHYKESPSEIATLDAFIKLTRASNTLHHQLSRSLAEYNLTESLFGVLEALYYLGPYWGVSLEVFYTVLEL